MVAGGRNVCEQHKSMLENNGRSKPRRSQQSEERAPPHTVAERRVVFLEAEPSCCICFNHMRDCDIAVTNCAHLFHAACLRTWRRQSSTCPTCRRQTNAFRRSTSRIIVARKIEIAECET